MRALRLTFLLALSLSVLSCATTQSSKSNLVLPKLAAMGVNSGTYTKIANHRVLNYTDIYGLVEKGVPSQVIVTYLKSTHAPYTLTDNQLNRLVDAGAKPDLVNYLGQSVGYFEATERAQTGGEGKWRYNHFFYDPYYMGEPPFMYGYPGEWFDPGWVGGVF